MDPGRDSSTSGVRKKVVDNSCVYVWSEEFVNSFSLMWHSFVFVSCIILAGLYSRVVHTLWFRRNDHDETTHHQQVWINRDACNLVVCHATL